ncbi:MAG TPA: M48 family metallopeptidase [Candidatus Saccharimonadales bacterium]|nr:M48 family metallopeptidase [Candidatus Saccharimonadales bacterium]
MTAYTEISSNRIKTWIIMLLFAVFIAALAFIFTQALGFRGPSALSFTGFALIIAGVMNFITYYTSDSLVMAISGAKKIEKKDNPTLFRTVENLCIASGLPMPKIYIIDDSAPNAFATGRDPKHASICFTTGILEKLNKLELEGVAAHELSHVGNYDTRLMSVVSILVGTVALLADWFLRAQWFGMGNRDNDDDNQLGAIFMVVGLVLAILAPIIATLIQLSVSRKREFLADASGALLTRNPDELANALVKISNDTEPLEAANRATAHLYIVNPFKGKSFGAAFANLFNTHPPIAERVKALRAMQ